MTVVTSWSEKALLILLRPRRQSLAVYPALFFPSDQALAGTVSCSLSSHSLKLSSATAGALCILFVTNFSAQAGSWEHVKHSPNTWWPTGKMAGQIAALHILQGISRGSDAGNYGCGLRVLFDIYKVEKEPVLQKILQNNYQVRKSNSNLWHKHLKRGQQEHVSPD